MDLSSIISLCAFIVASFTDIRFNKVDNRLTLPLIIVGLLYYFFIAGIKGIGFASLGMAIPFIVLYLFFKIGVFGAGDIKLLMAIGALCGSKIIGSTLLYGLMGNATVALVILVFHEDGWLRIKNLFVYLFNLVLLKKMVAYSGHKEAIQQLKFPLVPMFFVGFLVTLFRPIF